MSEGLGLVRVRVTVRARLRVREKGCAQRSGPYVESRAGRPCSAMLGHARPEVAPSRLHHRCQRAPGGSTSPIGGVANLGQSRPISGRITTGRPHRL